MGAYPCGRVHWRSGGLMVDSWQDIHGCFCGPWKQAAAKWILAAEGSHEHLR